MKNKNTISVILPIKSAVAGFFEEYLNKAIESIKVQKEKFDELIIVHTDESLLTKILGEFDFGDLNVKLESWSKEPNFADQVNHGVNVSTSEWISIFEFDDEYANIWVKNVKKYIDTYPNTGAFLPIVVDVDDKGVFVGFTNEASFASNISEEMGILTNETLHSYQNFQISGMVIKKDIFIEYGMIKSNFKLTFGYEFLLRMTQNSVKFITIPRIGYKHSNLREGSIFWNYKNGENRLTEDEVKFWIDSAKKEYFFNVQREINYEPQEI
jgi:glycosyltransferase involved in cell wall biosynthesis|tara:strand:+ start:11894 stop:12700 length:807 start_codon:yes stop_codon:yes gene_type:complete